MTPEEYQILIDKGYTVAEIKAMFDEDPPAGWKPRQTAEYRLDRDIYGTHSVPYTSQDGGTPVPMGQPNAGPVQRPPGVSEWTWNQYLQAQRDYDETWNDLKRGGVNIMGDPQGLDPALKERAGNAATLLRYAKAAVQEEAATAAKGTGQAAYSAGNTSSPYLVRQRPDGTLDKIDNPNYQPPKGTSPYSSDFTQGNTRYRYNNQGVPEPVFSFPEKEDNLTAWQKASLDFDQAKLTYEQGQDKKKREQWEHEQDRARREDAWQTAFQIGQQRAQLAPYALIPGQEYFLGHGPSSAGQVNAAKLGIPYDPNQFRVPVQQYDPEAEWRRAMEMYGRR